MIGIDLSNFNKSTGDEISAAEWNTLFGNIQSKINELVTFANSNANTGGTTPPSGNTGDNTVVGGNVTNLYINGELHTESNITLEPCKKYVISGELYGQIVVDARSKQPMDITDNTRIVLDGATIISEGETAISYVFPEEGKGYKGLYITLAPDSVNTVIAKTKAEITDDQKGAIYSMNNLRVQGSGYLMIKNFGGHGMRGSEIRLFNPHIYVDAVHDGIHAKTIVINEGVYYFERCNDCFGTSDKPDALIFINGGKYYVYNLAKSSSNVFDCKGQGYYMQEPQVYGAVGADIFDPGKSSSFKPIYSNIANVDTKIAAMNSSGQGKVCLAADKDTYLAGSYTEIPYSSSGYVIGAGYTGKKALCIQGTITAPIIIQNTYNNGEGSPSINVYLNNANITVNQALPCIQYLGTSGRVKVTTIKETYNKIINTFSGNVGTADVDAIKSENNLEIETGGDSQLFISSAKGDGVDASDVKITDLSGTITIKNCGQRGIKGTTIVVGPNTSAITAGNITIVSDPNHPDYTTLEGALIAINNCQVDKPSDISGSGDASKLVGFADIFARKGKFDATKGFLRVYDAFLNGVVICGTIGANHSMDLGNATNFFYSENVSPEKLVNANRAGAEQYLVYRLGQTPIIDKDKFKVE